MQSQLEAALLGHSSNTHVSSNVEDEENNFQEEEVEENEDDEEGENEKAKQSASSSNRTVTLQMLLDADILQPGKGTMTIEYLGQRFVGNLLEDGKIQSQETDIVFASPSAWAIACKRFINPDKKSGCGWASVKYRGRKLDAYKNVWYRKKKEEEEPGCFDNEVTDFKTMSNAMSYSRVVVKHNTIANRTLTHDSNTLIECVPFSNLGKIQPFLVSLSTNAALLMDFHCHLMKTEVSGYLAGQWDVNSHNLQITHAFPCRNTKGDRENAPNVEAEISKTIEKEKLLLVGWYHSHPFTAAAPTLRDIDAQLDYQIRMKGLGDNSYTPCIGVIISPYNYENTSLESSIIAYWVIPPPEAKPNEYGRPMLMSYSVIQDSHITSRIKEEMRKSVAYYQDKKGFVNFNERFIGGTLYIDKLKSTLISKFPREENETILWKYIREILGYTTEESDSLLSIPTVTKSQFLPTLNTPLNLNSNLMLPGDISSILFNSGKFPSASSILGLPDPMAHSTLAANNMFLQTNLFKMQELLKPLSTSSPLPKSKETKPSQSPLKIPSDIKSGMKTDYGKCDYSPELLSLKNKMEFLSPDLNFSKIAKGDFSGSDYGYKSGGGDIAMSKSDGEKPIKIPKSDYMLDLSMAKLSDTTQSVTDLSISSTHHTSYGNESSDDAPLNLTN